MDDRIHRQEIPTFRPPPNWMWEEPPPKDTRPWYQRRQPTDDREVLLDRLRRWRGNRAGRGLATQELDDAIRYIEQHP